MVPTMRLISRVGKRRRRAWSIPQIHDSVRYLLERNNPDIEQSSDEFICFQLWIILEVDVILSVGILGLTCTLANHQELHRASLAAAAVKSCRAGRSKWGLHELGTSQLVSGREEGTRRRGKEGTGASRAALALAFDLASIEQNDNADINHLGEGTVRSRRQMNVDISGTSDSRLPLQL